MANQEFIICVKSAKNQERVKMQLKEAGVESILIIPGDEQEKMMYEADDRVYIESMWKIYMNCDLNLDNPVTFNEKMQYLKLFDRKDVHTIMADKYAVKEYVSKKIGAVYVIPLFGVWDSYDEIDFNAFPKKFVLKCTHDSGSVFFCKDKKLFDRKEAKEKITRALEKNYYYLYREWPYKNIKPRIIAEEYIESDRDSLFVYKFMCFNGEPKIIQVIQNDKLPDESIDYFDENWELLDIRQNYPNSANHLPKPMSFDEMKKLASKLAKEEKFVRVDFYEIDNRPVFSEFTFYSDAGLKKFIPEKWDFILGEWIVL